MPRPLRTEAEMYPVVEAYLGREGTKKEFCARHDVPESVLTYWTAKYQRSQAAGSGSFVEITPPMSTDGRPLLEVLFPRGVRVRFFAPVPPTYLERLLGS